MSKLFVDEIVHQSSQGSGTITLGASGEKIDLGTGVSGGSLTNTPAFFAYLGSDQTVSDLTTTKVQIDTEVFDTHNAFDTSTYRFTCPTGGAGKYVITGALASYGVEKYYMTPVAIYKNGAEYHGGMQNNPFSDASYGTGGIVNSIVELAVNDYVELYGISDTSDGTSGTFENGASIQLGDKLSYLRGYRLIGA